MFFIAPGLVSLLVLLASPKQLLGTDSLPVWVWVLFVLMVDVTHVYASLYRTYFDSAEFVRRKSLYVGVPALCLLAGVVLYTLQGILFWRVLAYLAVIHFVRQQYGFLALYKYRAGEGEPWERLFDRWVLYLSMVYPLAYWHTHLPRKFVWFIEGDFFSVPSVRISECLGWVYLALVLGYVLKEGFMTWKRRPLSLGKNLLLVTTGLSWYIGIVAFNSDYSFTVTNVVTHGVPYVALVWIYCHRKWGKQAKPGWLPRLSRPRWVWAFVGLLMLMAYFEEGIWDVLVWGEHAIVFGASYSYGWVNDPVLLSVLIPFLALPQSTHYVLDAFIWKLGTGNPDLRDYLLT